MNRIALILSVLVLWPAANRGIARAASGSFVARDGAIRLVRDGQEAPYFVHAINLGVGVPGTQPGELAPSRNQYDRWFARMRAMGFTAVRIYTLHYPRFYAALREYNLSHPEAPLYLLHGIWLDEDNPTPQTPDLHNLTPIFEQGITEAVGAIHGSISIPHRFGRAYGSYTNDVSPWVMGWIIGREIYPDEVELTNLLHPQETAYSGTHVSLPVGTPTEVWLAERLDYLARQEDTQFGAQRPLSVSSWPTLDPLEHPTENTWSYEDNEAIDLANLDTSRFPAGYFASYHAYPYYPDFMSEDPDYVSVEDDQGPNSYLGYLAAMRAHYYPVPLFIAEFGVPSSWGNAHVAQSGMHHGGHDEETQGRFDARMFKTLETSGCAGGALFAWIDEWWKNTWIAEFLDFPTLSRPLWLNVTAPEQNFGLIAFDESPPVLTPTALTGSAGPIQGVSWAATARFFHIDIATDDTQRPLVIGFDTYGDAVGETVLPGGIATSVRSELALVLNTDAIAQLYVTEAYDLFGIWHERWNYITNELQLYHSIPTDGAPWVPVRWLSNRRHASDDFTYIFPETIDNEIGRLRVSEDGTFASSRHAIAVSPGLVRVRIPWTLLQFTDPTQATVMDDDRQTPGRETAVSEGIRLVLAQAGGVAATDRLLWPGWGAAPPTTEREKASLVILEAFLREPIPLRIVDRTSTTLTLDWTGAGVLEEASALGGPWTLVGQTAPATVEVRSAETRLFRIYR